MEELARQPWSWVLYEVADGRLILSVNCGTVASYEIFLELTRDEERDYRETGSPSVDALAKQVTSDPRGFGARNIRLDGENVVPAPLAWHRGFGSFVHADHLQSSATGRLQQAPARLGDDGMSNQWCVLTTRMGADIREPTDAHLHAALEDVFASDDAEHPNSCLRIGSDEGPMFVLDVYSAGRIVFKQWADVDFNEELNRPRN